MSLFEQLKQLQNSDRYPFHMPGHKRNLELMEQIYGRDFGNPFGIDITEIDGFDDLHHAEGIIKDGMEQMAAAVGARHSYFVVNGSSGGILAALYAACKPGSRVAVARNCHRSIAHGIILRQLVPCYFYPQVSTKLGISMGITCGLVEDILGKNGDISAVILTSPTYEGAVSDILRISEVVHRHGAVLIVDEAHGAHLPFGEACGLPRSAVAMGADLVIQSLHKTLPAMTQSAALHICSDRIDQKKVEQGLRIFETSSPSYVMMAGMDACMRFMEQKGREKLKQLCGWLDCFYEKAKDWDQLHVLTEDEICRAGSFGFDRTKLVFSAENLPGMGETLHRWLAEEYHLQPEMSTPEYVVLMTTIGDTPEGFLRLTRAMEEINRKLAEMTETGYGSRSENAEMKKADVRMLPHLAVEAEQEMIEAADAEGRISVEMAYIYPPGIPFLMPGERISREHVEMLRYYRSFGREIHGMEDETGQRIRVVRGCS
ncbi:MAG: aminotransferase class I/II-fold pyridoxal phosphate-dependent enzyme [Lachnospiraceae bacterium]|nr:aminotransferase class I/II-fold pyridoxal phosphate-dependent enzyme [Lachnospiraceae bacterium]